MGFIKHASRISAAVSSVNSLQVKFWSSSVQSRPSSRVVLVSTSNSIYHNLALEEWMYEHTDFSDTEYLFMWRNRPAIVFGRHQNPWMEVNVPLACAEGVDIARRSSGGGTVYHDEGNLNLSFLKARHRYNRKENLHLVVEAIKSQWDLDLAVNARDDIVLDQFYKVSGTAAKLGRVQSYHHFTLLLHVDTAKLWKLLDSPMQGVDSRATKSVPASVRNLAENSSDMTFELLVSVIGQKFLQEVGAEISPQNVKLVDPLNETNFPGVTGFLQRLQSWDWVYGKTPSFSLHRTFSGHVFHGKVCTLKVDVNIEKGSVTSISVQVDHQMLGVLMEMMNIYYSENLNSLKLSHANLSDLQEKSLEQLETCLSGDRQEELSVARWIVKSVDLCFRFV